MHKLITSARHPQETRCIVNTSPRRKRVAERASHLSLVTQPESWQPCMPEAEACVRHTPRPESGLRFFPSTLPSLREPIPEVLALPRSRGVGNCQQPELGPAAALAWSVTHLLVKAISDTSSVAPPGTPWGGLAWKCLWPPGTGRGDRGSEKLSRCPAPCWQQRAEPQLRSKSLPAGSGGGSPPPGRKSGQTQTT